MIVKFIRDTWLITLRNLLITFRNPWRVIVFGLFQPLCFLFLFAPFFKGLANVPNFPLSNNPLNIFIPGLLILMSIYNTAYVGFGLIHDIRTGVIERMRVTSANRLALLFGRSVGDISILFVQSIVLLTLSLLMGLTPNFIGLIISLVIVMIIGLILSSLSYAIALIVKNEYMLVPIINLFLIPMQLISGITIPLTFAPNWIQNIAKFNPVAHAVTASRNLFQGNIMEFGVISTFIMLILLLIPTLFLVAKQFKRLAY